MYINSRIKRNQKNSWIQIFIKIRWKRKEKQKKKTKQTQSIIVMSLRYITSTSNALPTVPRCRLPTGHRSLEAALALRKNKKNRRKYIAYFFDHVYNTTTTTTICKKVAPIFLSLKTLPVPFFFVSLFRFVLF